MTLSEQQLPPAVVVTLLVASAAGLARSLRLLFWKSYRHRVVGCEFLEMIFHTLMIWWLSRLFWLQMYFGIPWCRQWHLAETVITSLGISLFWAAVWLYTFFPNLPCTSKRATVCVMLVGLLLPPLVMLL